MREWTEQHRATLFLLLLAVLLAALVLLQVCEPKAPPPLLAGLTPAATPGPTPTAAPLRVYVSGAVLSPDVYLLPPGSIAQDAVRSAGGPTLEADLDRINLAQALADGDQVHVPRKGETPPPPAVRLQPALATRVNINTAGIEELDALPGIGPATAQKIVDYRQAHGRFEKAEDLMDVAGIGQATFDKLRELITTE